MLKLIISLFFVLSSSAWAYPTYVRLGYNNCTGCHVSAQGGGILTPYGKGIAMTQSFFAKEPDDEFSSKFVQALQFRAMRYKTEDEVRTFPMQMDYLVHDEVAPGWSIDGALAVAPKPKDETPENKKPFHERLYARILSVSYDLEKKPNLEKKLTFGIGPLPMGIGIVDHTAYVRAENRFQVTDNPIALKYYYSNPMFLTHTFLFGPNPNEGEGNREQGLGTQSWYRPHPQVSVGLQALHGKTDAITRKMAGLLLKLGISKWALLFEHDFTKRDLHQTKSDFNQQATYLQLSFYPMDFLHLYANAQKITRDKSFELEQEQNGFGAEVRLISNLSLSYEYRTRITGDKENNSQLLQLYFNWW
ncbi:MAG: hypothetical protein OHK0056_20330 [Bacteriovoracaceae bacterium]